MTLLSACSPDTEDSATVNRSGIFVDSPVKGLRYSTPTLSGVTDESGGFKYQTGESVIFSIGNIDLPPVTGREVVTALDIFATDDINYAGVLNVNRLLQTLDANNDPDDGIDLTALDTTATEGLNVDFLSPSFDLQVLNLVANSGNSTTQLVSAEMATEHFQQSLNANGLGTSGCGAAHPLVGSTAEFTTRAHQVVGTVTVLDDCTLEVTEFGYDGLGPNVYFYFGEDGNFEGGNASRVGERLNGKVYANDQFRLTLPDGVTLEDVNSLSVWCADFAVSFGDVAF